MFSKDQKSIYSFFPSPNMTGNRIAWYSSILTIMHNKDGFGREWLASPNFDSYVEAGVLDHFRACGPLLDHWDHLFSLT
jgi:hypothetical protein